MPYRRRLLYGLMAVLTAAATYAGWRFAGLVGAEIGVVCGIAVSAVGDAGKRRLDERETRRRDQKLARQLSARLPGWNCLWVREEHEADAVRAARQRKH